MKRPLLAFLLAAAPVLSTGQIDERVVKPEIRVGDSWTYRGTNILGPGTQVHESRVSFVDEKVILVVSTRKSDGKEFDSSWTSEWNAVTAHSGNMYRPHTGFFKFPLHVGERYELNFEQFRPRANTRINRSAGSAVAVGWETVDVPAGKFRAMRMEAEYVTTPSDGGNPFPQKGVYWYSPEVRRWVKFQFVGPNSLLAEELLEYKLNEN